MWIHIIFIGTILNIVAMQTKKNLKIGLLLPKNSPSPGFPDIYSSGGATSLALKKALLRYNVTLIWRDTHCSERVAMEMSYQLVAKYFADVILGPACSKSMYKVTELMSIMRQDGRSDVPTVTWLPRQQSMIFQNDTAVGTYRTFDSISQALSVVLKQHNWNSIGLIADRDELCAAFIETINDQFPNQDLDIRRSRYIDHFTNATLADALTAVGIKARVIVLCVPYQYLMSLLLTADRLNMTAREHVFIYCRFGPSPAIGLTSGHAHVMSQAVQRRVLAPLLQLGPFGMDELEYEEFFGNASIQKSPDMKDCCGEELADLSNQLELCVGALTTQRNIRLMWQGPDDFAFNLYQTILFVANVYNIMQSNASIHVPLHTRLQQSLAAFRNTSERFNRPLLLSHYQGGAFVAVGRLGPVYESRADIDWPGGSMPADSPRCGWNGDQCQTDDSGKSSSVMSSSVIIAVSVSTGVVIAVAIALGVLYRKYKFDKAVINMIWKINKDEITMRKPKAITQVSVTSRQSNGTTAANNNNNNHNNNNRKLVRMEVYMRFTDLINVIFTDAEGGGEYHFSQETRATMGMGSTSSMDRNIQYAPVGSYKGTTVAVKSTQKRSISLTNDMLRDLKALRELQHENLNPFIGASMDQGPGYILTKYCSKGSLEDVLGNDDIKLDNMFKISFTMDITKGLIFLHKSSIRSHGNLKSRNCLVDSRWTVKLTDFGAIVSATETAPVDTIGEHAYFSRLLWTAPELLRMTKRLPKGTQKGDVYSFAIILQEIYLRCHPYCNNDASVKAIIRRVQTGESPPYRPRILDGDDDIPPSVLELMDSCWQENPDSRPDMNHVLQKVVAMNGNRKGNIMDNMIKMLEAYSNNLEELVADRTEELAQEKRKTDLLLYQMLPPSVAEQLKRGEHVVPETFDEASLFFSDIVGFTNICSGSTALQVIDLLNDLYTTFDEIIGMHDVYKVETIGDAYMVASGIPKRNGKRHAGEIASMALDLLSVVTCFGIRHIPDEKLQLRIGLHTGPCASGVVGITMPRYCLFGDTINMAARMESTGKPFHIHCSSDFAHAVRDCGFVTLERGVVEVKGKGLQKTYWLVGMEGFDKPLPHEVNHLSEKFAEAREEGRSASPTDTHISTGSQPESTSMYGNAFRRVTNAMSFLRNLSRESSISVPGLGKSRSGSEVSLKNFSLTVDSGSSMGSNGKQLHRLSEGKVPSIEHDPDYHGKLPTRTTSLHVKRGRSTKRRHKHSLDHGGAPFVIPQIEISSDIHVHNSQ